MSKKHNGVNYGRTVPQRSRRNRALESLENQLKAGTKTLKTTMHTKVPLTDKDIKRINKEIGILKDKL
jgi:hypothetical protein